jgi:hypothetical protein
MDSMARGGVRRYLDTTFPEEHRPDTGEVNLSELSLTGLADLYGSDKGTIKHRYTSVYERVIQTLLRGGTRLETTLSICEFGVACGASLRMWANYLPKSTIHGFDIRQECSRLCEDVNNVEIIISDPRFFDFTQFRFDLVVEDASHISEDIVDIFKNSWRAVKPGGFYIIEDLACTYNPHYAMQFSNTFKRQVINDRSSVLNFLDSVMRSVDQRLEIAHFEYYPQMLLLRRSLSTM